MNYPICIEWGNEITATGIQIPDIPGAIAAGDTFEHACRNALDIAQLMLEDIVLGGSALPMPRPIAHHRSNVEFEGMDWTLLEVDLSPYTKNPIKTQSKD
jgi:predicted RNase H-like HicB family nuclease